MGRVDQSGIKPPEKHLDDFGESGINIINRPSVDHKRKPHVLLADVVWPHSHRTTRLRQGTQEATLSNIVHWDMFLLLQV